MADLERRIEWEPAFDRRDPDPSKNYGIHGVSCRWLVIGPEGAIQFLLYTNWQLAHVEKEQEARVDSDYPHLFCHPLPADLGYHARTPQYDSQEPLMDDCEYIGGPCYYDGSGLRARTVYDLLRTEGGEAVWSFLEAEYAAIFRSELSLSTLIETDSA